MSKRARDARPTVRARDDAGSGVEPAPRKLRFMRGGWRPRAWMSERMARRGVRRVRVAGRVRDSGHRWRDTRRECVHE